ncbi:MAG: hypothetical protein ACKO7R_07015 [Pseudanabaena sp.]
MSILGKSATTTIFDRMGVCRVCDPVENYKVVLTSQNYEEAQLWLLEDEFEPINGRL